MLVSLTKRYAIMTLVRGARERIQKPPLFLNMLVLLIQLLEIFTKRSETWCSILMEMNKQTNKKIIFHTPLGAWFIRQLNTTHWLFETRCHMSFFMLIFFSSLSLSTLFRYSNELLGLEGMVKIKNPDENLLNGNHTISITPDSDAKIPNNDITDSKRFVFFFGSLN